MDLTISDAIRIAGIGQLSVLIASSFVPFKLNWKQDLAPLPRLHRQMYWTYGSYVVLGIIALGAISLLCADELAAGSRLARAVCVYGAIFWGARLALQGVFDVKPHLTAGWFRAGYHTLTGLFAYFAIVYTIAAIC